MNPVRNQHPVRGAARRVAAACSAVVLVLGALVGLGATGAAAATQVSTSAMLDAVNKARAANGAGPLRSNSELTSLALRHSKRMATQNNLHHNPNLGSDVTGYRLVGENVGYSSISNGNVGKAVATVQGAFMDSSGHRANILQGKFTQIGIGAVRDGNKVWVTQVFRQPKSSSGGGSTTQPTPKKTKKKSTAPKTSRSTPKASKKSTKKSTSKPKTQRQRQSAPRSPSAPATSAAPSTPASKPATPAPETTPSTDPEPTPTATQTPSSAPTLTERVATASAAAVPAPDPISDALAFARAMHTVGG